jgi:uncharacterized repeat protein (TIGR01451 family)
MHNLKGRPAVPGGFARAAVALVALFVLVILLSTTAAQAVDSGEPFTFEEAQVEARLGTGIISEPKGATGSEIYLIRLSDPPVASYRGGIAGYQATNPSVRGIDKLDMDEPAAVAYTNYLRGQQAQLVSRMEQTLGRSVEVVYQYTAANNGVAAYMTPEEARAVSQLPGVIFVQRDLERELHTDNGPAWIGAPSIWGTDPTTREFEAELDESQVVPPSGSSATGIGTFTYDFATNVLTWNITHNVNTNPPNQWFAYIRHGEPGVNGPDVLALGSAASPIVGSDMLTDEEQGWLVNGELYVEIQREVGVNVTPEIRGQILPVATEGNMGEGIIIGVIDTGINPSNPSFADIGGDGYDHTNPWGEGVYVGVCDPANTSIYDPDFPCNDKLIGAWAYPSVNHGDARDYDGHGSHTASTAGGNFVFDAIVEGPDYTLERAISGVAPHANIVAYNACCTLSALTAAIDQIVLDGVDVVNYSIGSTSPSDIWNDFDTVGYLNARDAGIFVATSAGNAGPGPDTVGSPGDAPWLLSVGATTHDRKLVNSLVDMAGGDTTPPDDIFGKGFTSGYGPAEIVYAGDYPSDLTDTPELCGVGSIEDYISPWDPGTFNGKIVICDRGTFARVEKGFNVLAAGAGGMILANDAASGNSLNGDAHYLPAVHITYEDGVVLKAWVADGGDSHTGTIAGLVLDIDDSNADIMAAFSSRGANRALPDIIVPSVSAPGVDIMAAYGVGDPDPPQWNFVSGTSMASPHAAGAAALLMATNPNWSPAEVQSVMMTTAWTGVLDNDEVTPADPFDMGSGRIDLGAAAHAGLVLDETTDNYWAADPAEDGDPKSLNLASFGNGQCVQSCSWTRTVKSALDTSMDWSASTSGSFGVTVEPSSFTLEPGESQEIVVTADVTAAATGSWLFAEVQLAPDDAEVSMAHFPVAVMPTRGTLPDTVDIQTRRDAGSQLVPDVTAIEITELTVETFGLALGDQYDFQLDEDPTNSNPYNNLDEVWWTTVTVPAGAKRLVAEVVASTAVDIDLFVGTGSTPSAATEECGSTTPTFLEYCNVDDPAAGTWWVLVQNWAESASPPDDVTTIIGIVPGSDAGNMTVTGPASVPVLEPFDLRVFWNEPAMEAGDYWYGAFTIGTDAANPGNVGMVRVDLERLEDDVTKVADTDTAEPGDTVNYTITVLPNVLNEDVTYWITDTIPAGLTYVPGSALATDGTVSVTGNQLTWTGEMGMLVRRYEMSTSNEDPNCAVPLANSGAYLDLAAFGVLPNSSIFGNTLWFSAFSTGAPINYWGTEHTGINFTDDGMAFFSSTPGATPWTNLSIPNAADPNNLLAMFWSDFEVVYDAATNRGVSLATLGGTGEGGGVIIEYDAVEPFPAGSTSNRMDFEVFVWRSVDDTPGSPEIIFAYDNINFEPAVGTVGIENATGSDGIQFAYNDSALLTITDGMAICFDWVLVPGEVVTITYAATVDASASGTLTNNVDSTTSNPGSMLETTSAALFVEGAPPVYDVMLSGDQADEGDPGATITYNMVVTNTGNIADSFALTVDSVWDADLSATATGTLDPGQPYAFTVDVTIPVDAEDSDFDVATVTATSDGDPSVTDSAELTTTAVVETEVEFGVELSATTTAQSGYVGTMVVYTVDITNTGNGADSFNVAIAGHTWATTVAPANVPLQAGESAQLMVTVQIPLSAAHGAENTVTVTATSVGDPATSDSVQLTTTAQRYILFMPIIAKNG